MKRSSKKRLHKTVTAAMAVAMVASSMTLSLIHILAEKDYLQSFSDNRKIVFLDKTIAKKNKKR